MMIIVMCNQVFPKESEKRIDREIERERVGEKQRQRERDRDRDRERDSEGEEGTGKAKREMILTGRYSKGRERDRRRDPQFLSSVLHTGLTVWCDLLHSVDGAVLCTSSVWNEHTTTNSAFCTEDGNRPRRNNACTGSARGYRNRGTGH